MTAQPAGSSPTADADPDGDSWPSSQIPVAARRSRRRALIFATIGVLAYGGGLIAMLPASLVLPKSDVWQVGGTIWNGQAVIGGTTRLDWQWSALASLTRLAPTATWHLTGGETDLIGTASPGFHQLRLAGVSGVADGTLLNLAAPNLPVSCRFLAQLQLRTVVVGGNDEQAQGSLRTSPVHCVAKVLAATTLDLPALHGTIGPSAHGISSGALFALPSRQHLVEARLSGTGAFSLWPTAALTARVPALGGMRFDTTLHW